MKKRQTVWGKIGDVVDKRLMNYLTSILMAVTGVMLLIFAIIPIYNHGFVHSFLYGFFYFVVGVLLCGVFLSVLGEAVIIIPVRNKRSLQDAKRREREEAMTQRLTALTQHHPELIEFLEIQRIEQERQEEDQRRLAQRAFWQGVVQNFIFFLLGVLVPVLLAKLHLLGQ
jgi:hypothetical protein